MLPFGGGDRSGDDEAYTDEALGLDIDAFNDRERLRPLRWQIQRLVELPTQLSPLGRTLSVIMLRRSQTITICTD